MAFRLISLFVLLELWIGFVFGADHRGQVTSRGLPIPGCVIRATQDEKIVSTTTDERGSYSLYGLPDGTWTFEVDMPEFARLTADVEVSPSAPASRWELTLLEPPETSVSPVQDRADAQSRPDTHSRKNPSTPAPAEVQLHAGFPQVNLTTSAQGLGHINGVDASTVDALQEIAASANEALLVSAIGEGHSDTAGATRALRARYSGSAGLSLDNSVWDARAFSLIGQNQSKPSFARSAGTLAFTGPLRIPKLLSGERTHLTLSYSAGRTQRWGVFNSTLATALERNGDFSQSLVRGPVTIYDPLTRQPFPGNRIPSSRMDSAALGLLKYIPLPNQPGQVRNYQYVTAVPGNHDFVNSTLNHKLGRTDRLYVNLSLHANRGISPHLMGSTDTLSGSGWNASLSWTRTLAPRMINTARVTFSHDGNQLVPYFAFRTNVAAELGITGTSADPRNWGPPDLSFTNFGELDAGSASRIGTQTGAVSELLLWSRNRHTLTFGFEYSRRHINRVADLNARGSMSFTGLATSGLNAAGAPLDRTGFDFADFLLGLPSTSSVRFGGGDVYFRANSYRVSFQDDWRVAARFTLNGGLRYDYVSPVREKYNRMANLSVASGFTGATPILPGETLVKPDRNNVSPRVGLAWRPSSRGSAVMRAGYGWYFNTDVYSGVADNLAQQPPFAHASTIASSVDRPLTIQDGFGGTILRQVVNTYAVDPRYRVGYAQSWSVSVEQNLGTMLVGELTYLGTKGTALDMLSIPKRFLPATISPFIYESSDGSSIYHGGSARLSRRFGGAFTAQVRYTFAKSIDNASSVTGSGGGWIVQDAFNFAAERGLSNFDNRHVLEGNWQLTLRKNWIVSSTISYASGSPLTPTVLGNRADVAKTGITGAIRADATGLPVRTGDGFFNLGAFDVPPDGRFGNAGRGTIPGPAMFLMHGSVSRSISLGERRAVELRVDANNVLNRVNITRFGTVVNASNYGLATGAGAMRSLNVNVRFRF